MCPFIDCLVHTSVVQLLFFFQVDIQRLTSQKEYFDRSTADLERELQDAITNADTTERDSK